jgi:hypothetical protein
MQRSYKYLMIGAAFMAMTVGAQAQYDSDSSVTTPEYIGPMGPNVHKAFTGTPNGSDVQPGMDPGENAYQTPGGAAAGDMTPRMPQPMAPRAGLISDPQQIRNCLCMQTSDEMLRSEISSRQAAYSQDQTQRSTLEDQIQAAKAMPSSPDQIERVRELSQQRIILLNQINQSDIPQLQQVTQRYNQSASSYDRMCGSKSYDGETLARVKIGLTCQGG